MTDRTETIHPPPLSDLGSINMIKVYIGMLLVNIGCKKHSQAGVFLQPTPANIHRYQFNTL